MKERNRRRIEEYKAALRAKIAEEVLTNKGLSLSFLEGIWKQVKGKWRK